MSCLFAGLLALALPGVTAAQQASLTAEDTATEKLFEAVDAGDFAAAQAAVAAGADILAPDRWGLTPIDFAIDRGQYRIAHYLLSVRNFQRDRGEDGDDGAVGHSAPSGTEAPTSVGSETMPAVPATPVETIETAEGPQEADPLVAGVSREQAARPAWPAGKPNPFDPERPAPGATLQIIGPVQEAERGPSPFGPR